MTCKNCIHYDMCLEKFRKSKAEGFYELIDEKEYFAHADECDFFKDKSLYIELPCKVGDTVYVPWRWGGQRAVATVKVEEIKFYDSQMHYMFLIDMESDNECFNQSFGGWKLGKSIGKTVFLTREEAEKALEERNK